MRFPVVWMQPGFHQLCGLEIARGRKLGTFASGTCDGLESAHDLWLARSHRAQEICDETIKPGALGAHRIGETKFEREFSVNEFRARQQA